uniref:Membrane anchored junction protein n=1 Tax=Xiphophorus maculatus TaxID=8083 RepID=M4A2N0_XIPMA
MALRPFSFPSPETRFFTADSLIYKFKIRGGNSFSEDEALQEGSFDQEMEEIVRAVLGNLDCLQPFSTQHFIIFPYKKSWGKVCKHDAKKLSFYPFAIILYLEKNTFRGNEREKMKEMQLIPTFSDEPRPKRSRGDSPLEDAIIKRLMKDMDAESSKSVTGMVELEHQHTVEEAAQDPATTEEPQMIQFTAEKDRMPEKPGILKQLIRPRTNNCAQSTWGTFYLCTPAGREKWQRTCYDEAY